MVVGIIISVIKINRKHAKGSDKNTVRIVRRQYIVSFSNISLPLVQTQDHADVSAACWATASLLIKLSDAGSTETLMPPKHARKQVVCRAAAPDTPRTSPATAVH